MDVLALTPARQTVAEFDRQQNFSAFAFATYARFVPADSLQRDILQFRHTDTGGTDGFEQQLGALVAGFPRGVEQPEIFSTGKLAPRVRKDFSLPFKRFCLAGRVVDAFLIVVDSRKHSVHGGRCVPFPAQAVPPSGNRFTPGSLACAGFRKKSAQGMGVLFDGCLAVFLMNEPCFILVQNLLVHC